MQSIKLNSTLKENKVFNDPWSSFTKYIDTSILFQANEEKKESSEKQDYFDFLDKF
jgi:hypothetical protein